MIKLLKKNKIFTILLVLTIITVIISIVLSAILDSNTKKDISNNIIVFDLLNPEKNSTIEEETEQKWKKEDLKKW